MAVAAERYVGIPRPEAELQTAHHEAAQAALDGEGIVYAVTGTGLEMNGGEQPLWAVAVLGGVFPAEAREQIAERGVWKPRFLGSCFAFRHSNTFLTAAHCVEGIRPEDLIVECPRARTDYKAESIDAHPSADIALVRLDEKVWAEGMAPMPGITPDPAWGEDFVAFGFPEDVLGEDPSQPVPRVFKGYVQRVFPYDGPSRYRYRAAELNIPCPAGLSGGPLFSTVISGQVMGLVTENRESATAVGRIEEAISERERITRIERNVIHYGVALVLADVAEWVDELIPAVGRFP